MRRPKNRTIQEFPLTPEVGNVILKYLQMVRPQCPSRNVFLLLRGPHRPMKARHASRSIFLRLRTLGCHLPHYGPHVFRHTCATHLLDEGFSLKAIGDHLGHRSTRSTRVYAKVDGSVSRTKAKAFDAVPKMGDGLPEPACRSWLQTARCCCVQKAWW